METGRSSFSEEGRANGVGGRMADAHLTGVLLHKRDQLMQEIAGLREQIAVAANAIDAIDLVLETYGHTGDLEGRTPRAARVVLFYRNELRNFLVSELSKSAEPMTSRELACRICETEGKSSADRRMLSDITRRVGTTLRKMRAVRLVEGWRGPDGSAVWRLIVRKPERPKGSACA